MSSPSPKPRLWPVLFVAASLAATVATASAAPLRFCADPDDLPFSNRAAQGFDNRIAILLAHDLHRDPVFVWARSRRGFIREQFNKNACDVLMGVPVGMRSVLATAPYYRSTYVFVTRTRERLEPASFSDPKLNNRRIGLQIMEEDLSPPSLPLIRSGHAAQLVGFESFGSHASDIVRAVSDRQIDLAVVWGPLAGFYAARQGGLQLTPVSPQVDAGVPFTFKLAMGVQKHNTELADRLSAAIHAAEPRIHRILAAYHVPLLPLEQGGQP